MKGFITRALATACGAALLSTAGGCYTCDDFIDKCWPERYEAQARHEVNDAAGAQVHNGHILDQTVWNWMFEPGTDKLTPGGYDHLEYLARRRPCPDPQLYLQTALDITYDPAAPEKYPEARCELDAKRIAAIQKYLTAYSAGRHEDFQVSVIDPSDPSVSAVPIGLSVIRMWASSQGTIGVGGASPAGGAGAAPAR